MGLSPSHIFAAEADDADERAADGGDQKARDHLADVQALWRRDPYGYMRGVEPGVSAMLRAACRFPQSS